MMTIVIASISIRKTGNTDSGTGAGTDTGREQRAIYAACGAAPMTEVKAEELAGSGH
jgi:hypothetical protein